MRQHGRAPDDVASAWLPRRVWELLPATARKWNNDNCIRLAASLSYYTVFSLFPLILVTLTLARVLIVNSDTVQLAILDGLENVTGGFRDDFTAALDAAMSARGRTGIVGTALLILGASWVFGELVSAFNIIWGVAPPKRGGAIYWAKTTFTSFALVLGGIFLLLVSMIISAVLAAAGELVQGSLPGGDTLWYVVHTCATVAVLACVFALLLKWLPQTTVAWSDVWLGALLTAVLWSILQFAIAYYIAFSSFTDYGPVGAMLALIAWVYLSAQILFMGGEFTVVYAHRYGSRAAARPAPPASFPAQTA